MTTVQIYTQMTVLLVQSVLVQNPTQNDLQTIN